MGKLVTSAAGGGGSVRTCAPFAAGPLQTSAFGRSSQAARNPTPRPDLWQRTHCLSAASTGKRALRAPAASGLSVSAAGGSHGVPRDPRAASELFPGIIGNLRSGPVLSVG